jgi:putative DNA primase/helicase
MITKSTAVAPDVTADCPLWRKFLEETTQGDEQLQRYLAAVAGYAATGSTREHALFFV